MSVEFNEINYKSRTVVGEKTTAVGRLIMKISSGIVKNQQQANKVIMILTIIIFGISVYVFINSAG